ncbi:MAG: hypothetical protein HIU92_18935 [Proteobacteria bacterium]|nr:hypothetical protein [Pseudomonadota bacterium]
MTLTEPPPGSDLASLPAFASARSASRAYPMTSDGYIVSLDATLFYTMTARLDAVRELGDKLGVTTGCVDLVALLPGPTP